MSALDKIGESMGLKSSGGRRGRRRRGGTGLGELFKGGSDSLITSPGSTGLASTAGKVGGRRSGKRRKRGSRGGRSSSRRRRSRRR